MGPDWLGPFWWERQGGGTVNLRERNWTMIGDLGDGPGAVVDPRGLVSLCPLAWSVDWWVGAADRWHFPSRETAVTQTLLEGTPVVETVMRIPHGDAVARVWCLPDAGGLTVLEVENRSDTPVALALALRPYNPQRLSTVGRLRAEGTTVLVDGVPGLDLPRPPAGVVAATGERDTVHGVTAGRASPWPFEAVRDKAGMAQAAFVYPLAHTRTIRVVLRRPPEGRGPRVIRVPAPRPTPLGLPAGAAVARGWQANLRRGMRAELPDPRITAAVSANRAYLLLVAEQACRSAASSSMTAPFDFGDSAALVTALDRWGFHGEAVEMLACYPDRLRSDGRFVDRREAHDGCGANGPAISAIAEHARLTGALPAGALLDAVRRGAGWIARRHRAGRRTLPSSADHQRGCGRGLLDAAWLLERAGEDDAAAGARAAAAALGGSDPGAGAPGGPGAGPGEGVAVGAAGSGLSPYSTLELAARELEAGDVRSWRRLRWALDVATPTYTWPEAVSPDSGAGCSGDGHHGPAVAAFLSFVRTVLVRETVASPPGLALATLYPPEWAGLPVEVHEAPTHHGAISYAVRWHGERPGLLWECERPGVRISAPGLDPTWSSHERAGEALLAPYRGRVSVPLDQPEV